MAFPEVQDAVVGEVVDPLWEGVVYWATREQPKLQAEQQRKLSSQRIALHPEAARVQAAFEALEERTA